MATPNVEVIHADRALKALIYLALGRTDNIVVHRGGAQFLSHDRTVGAEVPADLDMPEAGYKIPLPKDIKKNDIRRLEKILINEDTNIASFVFKHTYMDVPMEVAEPYEFRNIPVDKVHFFTLTDTHGPIDEIVTVKFSDFNECVVINFENGMFRATGETFEAEFEVPDIYVHPVNVVAPISSYIVDEFFRVVKMFGPDYVDVHPAGEIKGKVAQIVYFFTVMKDTSTLNLYVGGGECSERYKEWLKEEEEKKKQMELVDKFEREELSKLKEGLMKLERAIDDYLSSPTPDKTRAEQIFGEEGLIDLLKFIRRKAQDYYECLEDNLRYANMFPRSVSYWNRAMDCKEDLERMLKFTPMLEGRRFTEDLIRAMARIWPEAKKEAKTYYQYTGVTDDKIAYTAWEKLTGGLINLDPEIYERLAKAVKEYVRGAKTKPTKVERPNAVSQDEIQKLIWETNTTHKELWQPNWSYLVFIKDKIEELGDKIPAKLKPYAEEFMRAEKAIREANRTIEKFRRLVDEAVVGRHTFTPEEKAELESAVRTQREALKKMVELKDMLWDELYSIPPETISRDLQTFMGTNRVSFECVAGGKALPFTVEIPPFPYERAVNSYSINRMVPENAAEVDRRSYYKAVTAYAHEAEKYCSALGADRVKSLIRSFAENWLKRYEDYLSALARTPAAHVVGPAKGLNQRTLEKRLNSLRKKEEALHNFYDEAIKNLKKWAGEAKRRTGETPYSSEIEELEGELARWKRWHEVMKEANKIIRSKLPQAEKERRLRELGVYDVVAKAGLHFFWPEPDDLSRVGFPSFELESVRDKIKRLEKRIEELKAKAKETKGMGMEVVAEGDGWKVIKNFKDDRVWVVFSSVPPAEVRSELKAHAFKWSPKRKAWVRKLTDNAVYDALEIIEKHYNVSGLTEKLERERIERGLLKDNWKNVWFIGVGEFLKGMYKAFRDEDHDEPKLVDKKITWESETTREADYTFDSDLGPFVLHVRLDHVSGTSFLAFSAKTPDGKCDIDGPEYAFPTGRKYVDEKRARAVGEALGKALVMCMEEHTPAVEEKATEAPQAEEKPFWEREVERLIKEIEELPIQKALKRKLIKMARLYGQYLEVDYRTKSIAASSGVGQAPPIYHRLIDKEIKLEDKFNETFNNASTYIIKLSAGNTSVGIIAKAKGLLHETFEGSRLPIHEFPKLIEATREILTNPSLLEEKHKAPEAPQAEAKPEPMRVDKVILISALAKEVINRVAKAVAKRTGDMNPVLDRGKEKSDTEYKLWWMLKPKKGATDKAFAHVIYVEVGMYKRGDRWVPSIVINMPASPSKCARGSSEPLTWNDVKNHRDEIAKGVANYIWSWFDCVEEVSTPLAGRKPKAPEEAPVEEEPEGAPTEEPAPLEACIVDKEALLWQAYEAEFRLKGLEAKRPEWLKELAEKVCREEMNIRDALAEALRRAKVDIANEIYNRVVGKRTEEVVDLEKPSEENVLEEVEVPVEEHGRVEEEPLEEVVEIEEGPENAKIAEAYDRLLRSLDRRLQKYNMVLEEVLPSIEPKIKSLAEEVARGEIPFDAALIDATRIARMSYHPRGEENAPKVELLGRKEQKGTTASEVLERHHNKPKKPAPRREETLPPEESVITSSEPVEPLLPDDPEAIAKMVWYGVEGWAEAEHIKVNLPKATKKLQELERKAVAMMDRRRVRVILLNILVNKMGWQFAQRGVRAVIDNLSWVKAWFYNAVHNPCLEQAIEGACICDDGLEMWYEPERGNCDGRKHSVFLGLVYSAVEMLVKEMGGDTSSLPEEEMEVARLSVDGIMRECGGDRR